MKIIRTHLVLFVLAGILCRLTSCCTIQNGNGQQFVTENHMCVLKNYTHITTEVLPLYISIDLPVKGPKPLMDSLTIFLNQVLYHYFDNGDDRHLPYETVYSKDVVQLVEHYRDTYKRFFLNDSTIEHEFESDGLSVTLCAKTDSYVTYEVDRIFFGEGDEVSKEWVTFILPNGHRLREIISNKNLLRFYEEHPELRSSDIWEHIQFHGEGIDFVGEIGLLNDSVVHQYVYAPGIFEDVRYPLDVIAPYLSKNAKKLIKQK